MPKRLTKTQFVHKARLRHGDKYDYSKTIYRNTRSKVGILCPDHGVFFQRADGHMAGRGCPGCAGNAYMSPSAFARRAYTTHGAKYSYTFARPRGAKSHVVIACPKHGKFTQAVDVHLAGSGCPRCRTSKGEDRVERWLIDHDIRYKRQKKVKYKRRTIIFDFYLPGQKTFIEYHGRQHYVVVPRWGGRKRLIQQRIRDALARLYCSEHGCRYIEIPYTERNQVGDVLEEALQPK